MLKKFFVIFHNSATVTPDTSFKHCSTLVGKRYPRPSVYTRSQMPVIDRGESESVPFLPHTEHGQFRSLGPGHAWVWLTWDSNSRSQR